jgi:hypothetical protein
VSERAFIRALDRANAGGQARCRQLPIYLALKNLKSVIPLGFSVPVFRYRMANNNAIAIGVDVYAIPKTCGI